MSDEQQIRDLITTWLLVDAGPANRRSGNTLTVWRKSADGNWQIFRDANLLTEQGR
ncbi:MAG: hypothetical protein ABI698_07355 [bacterium]